jgi:hypothetical protein
VSCQRSPATAPALRSDHHRPDGLSCSLPLEGRPAFRRRNREGAPCDSADRSPDGKAGSRPAVVSPTRNPPLAPASVGLSTAPRALWRSHIAAEAESVWISSLPLPVSSRFGRQAETGTHKHGRREVASCLRQS